jgi:plasmid stabilization system protein ParE
MPFRVKLSALAERDLDRIYRYIEAESSPQASVWFNGLHAALGSLSEMPERHPVISEDARLRHLLYGNKPHIYRIIYAVDLTGQQVNIVHVRHHARDAFKPTKTIQ